MKPTAYFDQDGICLAIVDGYGEFTQPHTYATATAKGTKPIDIYYDPKTQKAKKAKKANLKLPAATELGRHVKVKLPAGSIALVNGVRCAGEFLVMADQAGPVMIDVRGKLRGEYVLQVHGYAEARAAEYPSIPDQLDMIYHEGIDAWKARIESIKMKYPKP